MEKLRHWVMLLCCGCILYGLLENLLPRRDTFPVIKAVAVLYIVSILLSPAQSLVALGTGWERQAPETVATAPVLRQDAFLQRTEQLLYASLAEALQTQAPEAELLFLRLEGDEAQITEVHLKLRVPETVDREEIRRSCNDLLGMEGNYEWETG